MQFFEFCTKSYEVQFIEKMLRFLSNKNNNIVHFIKDDDGNLFNFVVEIMGVHVSERPY